MSALRTVDVLRTLRDGGELPAGALAALVADIVAGLVPDYQVGAFLMATCLRGLSPAAVVELTLAMRDSGTVIDLAAVPGRKVDKHSTGGVGDKISLALAPWVAACGVPVPMVSGRGLGHTGGTLDKLEAIPGFRVDHGPAHFAATVARIGVAMMGQTRELAPADRILYALRDVTATVESVPLITASILAKKLAEGIDALVLDVKVGGGAFMKDRAQAEALARSLVAVGSGAGLRVRALLTAMDAPLGRSIGNALEVVEALDILRGAGPPDTTELTLLLGSHMLVLGGAAPDVAAARACLLARRDDGAALARFAAMVEAHGGDPRVVERPALLPRAAAVTPVTAEAGGVVASIDAYALGQLAVRLGAGRSRADDRVDPSVGLIIERPVGAAVAPGDVLAWVHHGPAPAPWAVLAARAAIVVAATAPVPAPLLLGTIE